MWLLVSTHRKTLPLVCTAPLRIYIVQVITITHHLLDPEDYMSTSTLLTFGPDTMITQVSIPIVDDSTYEPVPAERLFATLGLLTTDVAVVIRPAQADIFIEDNDCKLDTLFIRYYSDTTNSYSTKSNVPVPNVHCTRG